jgi:DNA-binding NarL/FixJ family response regulator
MARLLLIEDEPVLRSAMARGLGKLAGVSVVEAGTRHQVTS